jgi:XTP/dITP diphosphohydrolase
MTTGIDSKETRALLLASFNPGKVKEIRDYLSTLPFDIFGLEVIPGLQPCPEIGSSFAENARHKAEYYSQFSVALTIADDSGLVVDALDGQPGIHSARFVSESATDEERYREVLFRMRNVPSHKRTARFVCCIVMAREGRMLDIFEGTVEGLIVREPRGENGFGYDPIFLFPKLSKTLAELDPSEKLVVSHRGQALQKLFPALQKPELLTVSRRTCLD